MGGFSIWLWLIALAVIAGIPVLVAWLVFRASRRGAKGSPATRLIELAHLKEKGLITEKEYERKRADLAQRL